MERVPGLKEAWMSLAVQEAQRGLGRTRPNPPVGAVIVQDGKPVGRGFHPQAGEPHAEVFALRDAGERARGADLYVTLEPCNHTGRTGPCTEAVIAAGIRRVYVGCQDPNPRVAGRGLERLRAAGIEVESGILEDSCRRLIAPFAKHMRTGLPWTLFKAAMTLDGRMATRTGDARWVSGEASRREVHCLRDQLDAIMVGVGTVLADDPRLTTRLDEGCEGRDPLRVVVDSRLRLPPDAAVLAPSSSGKTLVACCEDAAQEKIEVLVHAGAEVLVLPTEDDRVSLPALWQELGARGLQSLLLEGGPTLAMAALQARLIDRVRLYLAPKLLGGDDGVPLFRGVGPQRMADAILLTHRLLRVAGEDVVIEGDLPCLLD